MGDGERVRAVRRVSLTQVDEFLVHAVEGDGREAVGLALRLLDDGVPGHQVISELLVPAQFEAGRRWELDEWSFVEEHRVSGSVGATLHALSALSSPERVGRVLHACPEGDWHSIPAHMFSLQLQYEGVEVRLLGPSSPADHVAGVLAHAQVEALVVTCTMPTCFAGVVRLVAVAHERGLPVLVGGGALVDGRDKVERLGGDAWVPDIAAATAKLQEWREDPPRVRRDWPPLPARVLELDRTAQVLATLAGQRLVEHLPSATLGGRTWILHSHLDLELLIHCLASAELVRDDAVFLDAVGWLEQVLAFRDVPREVLRTALDCVAQVLPDSAPTGRRLLRLAFDKLWAPRSA
jgi:methanogenic corrinoid protein MtbC1